MNSKLIFRSLTNIFPPSRSRCSVILGKLHQTSKGSQVQFSNVELNIICLFKIIFRDDRFQPWSTVLFFCNTMSTLTLLFKAGNFMHVIVKWHLTPTPFLCYVPGVLCCTSVHLRFGNRLEKCQIPVSRESPPGEKKMSSSTFLEETRPTKADSRRLQEEQVWHLLS